MKALRHHSSLQVAASNTWPVGAAARTRQGWMDMLKTLQANSDIQRPLSLYSALTVLHVGQGLPSGLTRLQASADLSVGPEKTARFDEPAGPDGGPNSRAVRTTDVVRLQCQPKCQVKTHPQV